MPDLLVIALFISSCSILNFSLIMRPWTKLQLLAFVLTGGLAGILVGISNAEAPHIVVFRFLSSCAGVIIGYFVSTLITPSEKQKRKQKPEGGE